MGIHPSAEAGAVMRAHDLADYIPPSMEDGFALYRGLCGSCDALVKANVMFTFILTLCEPCVPKVFDTKSKDRPSAELCAECSAIVKTRLAEHHLAATNCDYCKCPLAVAQLPISTYVVSASHAAKPWWADPIL